MIEKTFTMIKPDAVSKQKIGEVIKRIETAGLKITAMKMIKIPKETAEKNYGIHKGKPFYENLIERITSGPVVCMVLKGENVVERLRKLIGATDPAKAEPGTIRGDLAKSIEFNVIHASDSVENAEKEISIFFKPEEIMEF